MANDTKPRYEYKIVRHLDDCQENLEGVEEVMNWYGNDGWLLVEIVHLEFPPYSECRLIFYREKK